MPDESSDQDEIGVICQACKFEVRKSVGWIRIHTELNCPRCGAAIDIQSRNFRAARKTYER